MRYLALLGLFLVACTSRPGTEEVGRSASPIVGGRPSGDDENASVYIVTGTQSDAGPPLRCSGRIIAPGLVATARHCRCSVPSLCRKTG